MTSPLKRLREARGLTGEELGRLVGKQKTTISKWELDQRRISVVNARLLARALDCDWPEIFGMPPRPPADVLELSRRVAELPPEDRDRVSQFVAALAVTRVA
jgi:transcriptional regulator with XRE-family HTH domain